MKAQTNALCGGACLLALILLVGCGYPQLDVRPGSSESRRENLVWFLGNRALMAHYQGRDREMQDSLDLAAELSADRPHLLRFVLATRHPDSAARFVPYTDWPAYPEKRIESGTAFRAVMYPIWGLPFDLAEAPLKAAAGIPGVSFAAIVVPVAAGEAIMPSADDQKKKEHHSKVPKHGKHSDKKNPGKDRSGDESDYWETKAFGAALMFGPIIGFYGLNGLQAVVYPADWDGRLDDWGTCAFWYVPDESGLKPANPNPCSPFFANAQRIVIRDQRVYDVHREVQAFVKTPLSVHNNCVERLNRILAQSPAGTDRAAVAAALAEEMRCGQQAAAAPLRQPTPSP